MCSWAQTSPVCQSVSFQNETCGAPGKVGWSPAPSEFILLCYSNAAWFHMCLFCQWMGGFAIQTSEKWDFGVLVSISWAFFPFPFIWEKVKKFGLRLTAVLEFFLLICFFSFPTVTPKKNFFHFPFIFAWFDPGRGHKDWLCFVSKGHSHCQGMPTTWET